MSRVFLPQSLLEEWALKDRADVQNGTLVVSGDAARYPVAEAFHFTKLASGPDEHKLLHKVKTPAQLEALKAEVMSDSAIAGESAYDVTGGYVVEVAPEVLGHAAPAGVPSKPKAEADLLADFLLNKL